MDDRRLGAMLGAACGDALGTTLEFSRPDPKPWSPQLDGPHCEIIGGGPFEVLPGQVTDDTHMAACLAASLASSQGGYDAKDAASRYLGWMRVAFDVGGQTRAALAEFARTRDPLICGLTVWRDRARSAAGNGSLMRCMPIGALIWDPISRREAAILDSLITHADPRSALACARYVAAIGCAVNGGDAGAMLHAAREEGEQAAAVLLQLMPDEEASIVRAKSDLDEDLFLAEADNPDLYGAIDIAGSAMGFVRTAFRLAFWELMFSRNYEAGVVDAVNRGGDADTNGAIVGGLLGALYGFQAIRPDWLQTTLECKPAAPWDEEYHPKIFLDSVGSGSVSR
jgi:ADP-ribosylglycohydrolase